MTSRGDGAGAGVSDEACEGVKVVEFAAYAAGPVVGKHLADLGATVVHVESWGRPDGFRAHYPPYADNTPGLDRSGTFAAVSYTHLRAHETDSYLVCRLLLEKKKKKKKKKHTT